MSISECIYGNVRESKLKRIVIKLVRQEGDGK